MSKRKDYINTQFVKLIMDSENNNNNNNNNIQINKPTIATKNNVIQANNNNNEKNKNLLNTLLRPQNLSRDYLINLLKLAKYKRVKIVASRMKQYNKSHKYFSKTTGKKLSNPKL
jgi:menaquinone-dependent protoporphyrinogen IX oxidase